MFIIVANKGYDYKHYTSDPDSYGRKTLDVNVHMSCNGPIQATFEEFDEINKVVALAREYLTQE